VSRAGRHRHSCRNAEALAIHTGPGEHHAVASTLWNMGAIFMQQAERPHATQHTRSSLHNSGETSPVSAPTARPKGASSPTQNAHNCGPRHAARPCPESSVPHNIAAQLAAQEVALPRVDPPLGLCVAAARVFPSRMDPLLVAAGAHPPVVGEEVDVVCARITQRREEVVQRAVGERTHEVACGHGAVCLRPLRSALRWQCPARYALLQHAYERRKSHHPWGSRGERATEKECGREDARGARRADQLAAEVTARRWYGAVKKGDYWTVLPRHTPVQLHCDDVSVRDALVRRRWHGARRARRARGCADRACSTLMEKARPPGFASKASVAVALERRGGISNSPEREDTCTEHGPQHADHGRSPGRSGGAHQQRLVNAA
jgi:hypothetical protein